MSNRRRPARMGNHTAYLASPAWHARRRRWHAEEEQRSGQTSCCFVCFTTHRLQLHHLDYAGMFELQNGIWVSHEAHEDLIALCDTHHEGLHRRLDNDAGYRDHLTRRAASLRILRGQRRQVVAYLTAAASAR